MKSLLKAAIFTGLLAPSLAWSAPPDMTAVNRATKIMGDCARIADEIAAVKAPEGLVPGEPAGDQFIRQMAERSGRLEECGRNYKAALEDSETFLEKLESAKLTEQEAEKAGDAVNKYEEAKEKLEQSLDALSANDGIQPYIGKSILEYFLKGGDEAGDIPAAAPVPSAGSGLDADLSRQLAEAQEKEKAQQLALAETAKNEAQALKELQERQKEEEALKKKEEEEEKKAGTSGKASDPLSRSDTRAVMKWIAKGVASARQPYCYKDSYGRGAGAPLSSCPSDKDKSGLLCYPKCKNGYDGAGPVCWQKCPSGYFSTGAYCHINKPLTKKGTWKCSWKVGKTCMMKKLTCPGGYAKAGLFCALKAPAVPAGYKGPSGLDLAKASYGRGAGSPMDCKAGQQEDAGLCYKPCESGFSGVGPVCWMNCPKGKTNCGAGCADSKVSCVSNTAQMVVSPVTLAMNIASAGTVSAVAYPAVKAAFYAGSSANDTRKSVEVWVNRYSEDFAQLTTPGIAAALAAGCRGHAAAEKWLKEQYALQSLSLMLAKDIGDTAKNTLATVSNFEPTGVAGVISAYSHPVCVEDEKFPAVKFLK
ncbi:MAG: hypothetical protein PHV36_13580 [Elusimicrobiales bacterium]|nr:hypothetical protein [Elusimicrobiales bacterium]